MAVGITVGSVGLTMGHLTMIGRERLWISLTVALGLGAALWALRDILHMPLYPSLLLG